MQLYNGLNYSLAVGEIGQAAEYLDQTGSPRVGITGDSCPGNGDGVSSPEQEKLLFQHLSLPLPLSLPLVMRGRVAAGFCMGGALSFAAAQKVPLIVAAAPNYGTPNPQQFQVRGPGGVCVVTLAPCFWFVVQVEEIKIPILATCGGKDMVMGFSDPAVRP
ncbi:hypothetical protein QJQ45_030357, partial [Haematococcus lacustris]